MNLTNWTRFEFPSKTGMMYRITITEGLRTCVSEHYANTPGSKTTYYAGANGKKQYFNLEEAKRAALDKALEDLRKEIKKKQKIYEELKKLL